MKRRTIGLGEGDNEDIFNKDKRGRQRERGSQRAAPATGSKVLWAKGPMDKRKRGYFSTREMKEL